MLRQNTSTSPFWQQKHNHDGFVLLCSFGPFFETRPRDLGSTVSYQKVASDDNACVEWYFWLLTSRPSPIWTGINFVDQSHFVRFVQWEPPFRTTFFFCYLFFDDFRSPNSRSGVSKVARTPDTPSAERREGTLKRRLEIYRMRIAAFSTLPIQRKGCLRQHLYFSLRNLPLTLSLRRGLDLCTVSGREMVSGSKVRMSNSLQSQMTPLPASMKSRLMVASLRCSDVIEVLRCIARRSLEMLIGLI